MPYEQTEGIFDFNNLPSNFQCDVQSFGPSGNVGALQRWVKPRSVAMIYIMCLSSGGGGGGGFSAASTNARGGGGGGACGGMSVLIKPALFLPDNLLVSVAPGGLGGSGSGQAGGAGANSIVSYGGGITAFGTVPNIVLQSGGSTVPGGGGAATGAAAGAAGAVPTVATAATIAHSVGYSLFQAIVGIVGQLGGAQTGAVGVSVSAGWNLIPVTPGAGGAGVNTVSSGFAGGGISLQAAMDFADGSFTPAASIIAGGVAGSAAAAGNGNTGLQSLKPFVSTGGSGGGSSDGSTGGAGGNGGIGSGGGGGGGGVTGGRGGNGGDGLVVIISW